MPQRKMRAGRCDRCGLHLGLCVCDRFPTVESSAALVVVRHIRERFKPTNTGRWLADMIPGTVLTHFGQREPPFDPSPLQRPDVRFSVLFPREDATVLDAEGLARLRAELAPGQRLGFVLLDGTWHQCSRMSRRVPVVQDLPCVALPPGPPSRWGVRTQHDERGLSTFEAGLRLVSLVDGPQRAAPLRELFHELAARALFMKARLPKPEIPEQWRHDVLPGEES
ncbi:tRNA-uridine aminocarboxypropyltransferase [Paraliomyxa miuraensis]|uniref:tRNA-uridine aminocarboxypropyltransferase n=1 Tax=Paraliomyxa miuraensis TaxID=376150 RepID=UPI00225941CF|nr:tRNA-uridine aminocarboxypropyltransferase [Paraliomyxa miuraensis]MCX4248022.1 DTW domain-containing protein [Paraliomyxa miuraensis]